MYLFDNQLGTSKLTDSSTDFWSYNRISKPFYVAFICNTNRISDFNMKSV